VLSLVLEGIGYGLFLAILVGPIMLTLVHTSLHYGIKMGMWVGSGIWVSDTLVVLALMSSIAGTENENYSFLISNWHYIAAVFFVGMGMRFIYKSRMPISQKSEINYRSPIKYFLKGFSINTINPFTWVFWTTMVANKAAKSSASLHIAFFSTLLLTIIFTDITKILLAKKLSKLLEGRIMKYIQLIIGIVFIIYGFYILVSF
jgi:threonine/homoserine/homoserine lactone efflux protein